MKVIYPFYRILDTMHSFQTFLSIGNIKQQLFHPGVSLTKLINNIFLVIGKKTEYHQRTIKVQSIQKPKKDIVFFFVFFIRIFYHTNLHLTGQQGKGEDHYFSVPQFHPLTNIYSVEMSNAYFYIDHFVITRLRLP